MGTIQKEQLKYINFLGVSLQYTLINGVFWLNATEILNAILDVSIVQINKLKDGEHTTLDGVSAVQVFVPFSVLSLTVQKLLFSKASKTDYFDKIMDGGGIEKLNQMLHHSNNMIFHTVESLLKDLDTANNRSNKYENELTNKNVDFDTLKDDYETLTKNANKLSDDYETLSTERDEAKNTIELLNDRLGANVDHATVIEKLNVYHEAEKVAIQAANDEKAAKVTENHTAEIQQMKDDHQEVLRPLLERSNLRKFWLGRDASLYAQIALQLVCMAFMFPLINKHYPFESLPTWLGVVFQIMLTAMLPIASILFALRKKKYWLWGIVIFEVLFSNSQTKLFNPLLGDNIHLIENTAVTFFLPLLLVAFGTLTSERETNKALLETPKE